MNINLPMQLGGACTLVNNQTITVFLSACQCLLRLGEYSPETDEEIDPWSSFRDSIVRCFIQVFYWLRFPPVAFWLQFLLIYFGFTRILLIDGKLLTLTYRHSVSTVDQSCRWLQFIKLKNTENRQTCRTGDKLPSKLQRFLNLRYWSTGGGTQYSVEHENNFFRIYIRLFACGKSW
jgi:hypothetical protein